MDISITIPKGSYDEWKEEIEEAKEEDLDLLFRVPFFPKNAKVGDKCFVVYNNEIIGYHIIKDFVKSEGFTCEITGNYWAKGNYIIRHGCSWTEIPPRPRKSHRGFQYIR